LIIETAPGGCGLVGNPTDMYGGNVISCSTAERARCAVADHSEIVIEVSGQSKPIRATDDLAFRDDDYLNIVRAVLIALEVTPGVTRPFKLVAETQIPMQAGLAGSTALLATIVGSMLAHLEIRLNPYETAELVRKIEYDIMKCICGFQDHYMATFGSINYMDFRGKTSAEVQDANTPFATIEPLDRFVGDLPLILAHTGVKHHSGSVHKSVQQRWLEGEQYVIDAELEIAQLAREGKKALLSADWEVLGSLMNRNHAIVRDLGGSGEANENLIAAALAGGAIGAKLAGAGGGGTIIALTLDPERTRQAVIDAGSDRIMYPKPSPGLTVEVTL